ncbi:MAG: hypothetical protein JKY10_07190, partial [Cohaesibacteraceae bacterium]|nr:hypothetical protein [Cohaesibacteraceae bacterium]
VLRRLLDARKGRFANRKDDLRNKKSRLDDELDQQLKGPGHLDFDQDYFDFEVGDIVSGIFRKITGREQPDFIGGTPASKRGSLKERTWHIPDLAIEEFLESNIEAVGRRYARQMSADIELSANFGKANLDDLMERMTVSYDGLRTVEQARLDKAVKAARSDKEKKTLIEAVRKKIEKLSQREKDDIEDIKQIRDMLRGQHLPKENSGMWARIVNVASIFNYVRALGGVTLSSLPDIARPMMVHGFKRYMSDGLKPLIANRRGFRASVAEARLAGTVVERELNSRLATWAELADPYSHGTMFENFMQNAARQFSKANGFVYWTDFQKSIASVMTQNRILMNVRKYDQLPQKERSYLAYLGIDQNMAKRMAGEFKSFGQKIEGVQVAKTDLWKDPRVVRAFRSALHKDVDTTIVTKGIADVPLWMHTPTGRLISQFRGFALAAHQRVLLRGLQEDETGVLIGLMFATSVGMLVYALKNLEANRELSDNPGTWIAEGLDRSGIFTLMFELSNTAEKVGAPGIYGTAQSLFPDRSQKARASRFANRNMTSGFVGPSFSLIEDFTKLLYAGSQGDLTPSDIKTIKRLAPYGNLPVIRSLLDYEVIPRAQQYVQ